MRTSWTGRLLVTATVVSLVAGTGAGAAPPVTPAPGTWSRVGPETPPLLDFVTGGAFNHVGGTEVGPDGRLYFFGSFKNAGGDPTADNLAVYDPATDTVSGIGSNGAGDGAFTGTVYDVAFVGSTLYAGGSFLNAAGIGAADALAAWNGSSWSARPRTSGTILDLASSGGKLYAAGGFSDYDFAPNGLADNVAVWDGLEWSPLGSTMAVAAPVASVVDEVLPLPDGRVFVVGRFDNAGGVADADRAAWVDAARLWHPVGNAVQGTFNADVYAIALVGNSIYLAGAFTDAAGDLLADRVVRWTGSSWKHLGSDLAGTGGAIGSGVVSGLEASGSRLVVSGSFASVGGLTDSYGVGVWNGSRWLALPGSSIGATVGGTTVAGSTLFVSSIDTSLAGGAGGGLAAFGLPGNPSAPGKPSALVGKHKVALTWTKPSSSSGAPLTDYVVQYRRKGTSTWKTFADGAGTTRSAVVTGLTSAKTYQFRVKARTDWGTSVASKIAVATPT